tara:strand:+ start:748 stop:1785 length:1038 start_codon:yes stop_codon:yes gene_type:complete
MGIKNFHTFMRKKAPNSYKKVELSILSGKRIAIDTSIFMCRYKSSLGYKWMSGFYTLIYKLISNNIHFIFVFDGKAPPEKDKEREERMINRAKVKNKISNILEDWYKFSEDSNNHEKSLSIHDFENYKSLFEYLKKLKQNEMFTYNEISIKMMKMGKNLVPITKEDFNLLMDMFSQMNIQYMVAVDNQEAESLCVLLNKKDIVDSILTEDTDVIAYGCKEMFFNLDLKRGHLDSIQMDSLLMELNLTYTQLKDFCIMCGNDYNKNIHLVGPCKSYELIQECKTLETITEKLDTRDLNFVVGRTLFDCERFSDSLIISSIRDSSEVKVDTLETKKFLFKNNIKLLF